MNATIGRGTPASTAGGGPPRTRSFGPPAVPGLRVAWWLSALVAVLSAAAAMAGLWIDGLYPDSPVAAAAFRGNDFATLVAGVPLLALALAWSGRGSMRAQLVWVGMLAYSVYNYAYYVYGAEFNALFLLHVTVFVLSMAALALALGHLDVAAIAARFGPGTPTRWISGLLVLLSLTIIFLYALASVRFTATGQPPADVLPLPLGRVHLSYAIDLTLLVPSMTLAAVLLWRRTAGGYVLGTATCLYAGVYQFNYIAQKYFVATAGIPDVARFDPRDLPILVALLLAALLLLVNLRQAPSRRAEA